jgi:hypothetical protein
MDWYTAYENLVIEEFIQRSMCALLEILLLHGAHLQQQGFPQEFLILFFLATAERKPDNPTLFSECRPACPIKEPACPIKEPRA